MTPETHVCTKCHRSWQVMRWPFHCPCGRKATSANVESSITKSLGKSSPKIPKQSRADCIHRGDLIRLEECASCGGKTSFKIFACAVHGQCAISSRASKVATCDHCRDYQKYRPVTTRNLIYHVCPLANNDGWRHNVRQLLKRWHVFNGRRIIAIARGDGLNWDQVHAEFGGEDYEFFYVENDRELREVASFLPLLEAVQNTNRDEAVFYAHTKGNSTADHVVGAQRWTSMMYAELLDKWQPCMMHLQRHPAVGCNKMVWGDKPPPYPSRLRHGNWMFSGTFWWARHDVAFNHPRWREVPRDRYGAEAWLAGLIDWWQGHSVFQPWPEDQYPTPSPYDPNLYSESYDEAWR